MGPDEDVADAADEIEEWEEPEEVGEEVSSGDRILELGGILDGALYPRDKADDFLPRGLDNSTPELVHHLAKREGAVDSSVYWDRTFVSVPPGTVYGATDETFINGPDPWQYKFDDTAGKEQFVYMVNEQGMWENHDVRFTAKATTK